MNFKQGKKFYCLDCKPIKNGERYDVNKDGLLARLRKILDSRILKIKMSYECKNETGESDEGGGVSSETRCHN